LSDGHVFPGDAAVRDARTVDSVWSCDQPAAGFSRSGRAAVWTDLAPIWPVSAGLWNEPKASAATVAALEAHAAALGGRRSSLARLSKVAMRERIRSAATTRHERQDADLALRSSPLAWAVYFLQHMVNVTQPARSLETGFASGMSALAIMSALPPSATHVAIDPFQPAFGHAGVRGAHAFVASRPSGPSFVHVNETASVGMAWALRQRQCFDLIFLDDGHKFDDSAWAGRRTHHGCLTLSTGARCLAASRAVLLTFRWLAATRRP
jgi:hypothetical protein